jgi:hypothetical protein
VDVFNFGFFAICCRSDKLMFISRNRPGAHQTPRSSLWKCLSSPLCDSPTT